MIAAALDELQEQVTQAALAAAEHKLRIERVEVSPYVDHTGADALRVVVVIPETLKLAQRKWEMIKPVYRAIHDTIEGEGIDLYPYVRFLKPSELNIPGED